jgi:hypothetical protein
LVTDDRSSPEPHACVDNGTTADRHPVLDYHPAGRLPDLSARAGSKTRLFAKHDEILDGAIRSQFDAAVNDGPGADAGALSDAHPFMDHRSRGDCYALADVRIRRD